MTYQPNIPTGSVALDQDYLNLQGNFQSLNTIYATDHTGLTITDPTQGPGYHKSVHLVPFSSTTSNPPNNQPVLQPTTTPGFGILYDAETNDGIDTDQTLYFKTGDGKNIQLTRNVLPLATDNGYSYLPGGFIISWGVQLLGGETQQAGTVAFPQQFTTDCFTIQLTLVSRASPSTSSSDNTVSVVNGTKNNLGFNYKYNGEGGTNYPSFFWLAIGF